MLRLIAGSNQNLATDKSRELALIQSELRKAIREIKPDLDPTVESFVNDLSKINIDDDAPKEESDESDDKNKSNESFAETLSADSSVNNSKEGEEIQPAESEQKIVDLIMDSKWKEAVEAYRVHKTRWPSTLPLAYQVIGTPTEEDDIGAMLNLYCAALAEKSNIFVMTLSDQDISESCTNIQFGIQQLSQTVKQLDNFQKTQQKLKSPPVGAPPPPPPPAEENRDKPVAAKPENPTPEPEKSKTPEVPVKAKTPEVEKAKVPTEVQVKAKTPEVEKAKIPEIPEKSKTPEPETSKPSQVSDKAKTPEPLEKPLNELLFSVPEEPEPLEIPLNEPLSSVPEEPEPEATQENVESSRSPTAESAEATADPASTANQVEDAGQGAAALDDVIVKEGEEVSGSTLDLEQAPAGAAAGQPSEL